VQEPDEERQADDEKSAVEEAETSPARAAGRPGVYEGIGRV